MSLLDAINTSNNDAKQGENPQVIFNDYERIKAHHDMLLNAIIVSVEERFKGDINKVAADNSLTTIGNESKCQKFKLGNGEVYLTISQSPSSPADKTRIKKSVLVERGNKNASFEIEAGPIFFQDEKIYKNLRDLNDEIKKSLLNKVDIYLLEEIKQDIKILDRNSKTMNHFEGNIYQLIRDQTPLSGDLHLNKDFKTILDSLFRLSGLFDK